MTRPPLVGAALWNTVMRNAEDRCECRGVCGSKHDPERRGRQMRCPHENGMLVSKIGEIKLIAVPRDPSVDFTTAASLPASRLIALCPACDGAVRRIFKRAEKRMPPQENGLFDSAPYYVDPASKRQADVGAA
ncbi:hypothetical protein [Streptomyces rimosus]|uniref:hypothetical protein n=1 Tax=Streptomyces rimosus TaxID=1927 RepID=UPI00067DFAB2|nr:hypothetical protein [Streptomyces rimosus]